MRPYEETIERAAELVRMVIPKLAQAKLPINPINYALWYEYFLGRDKALMNSLDQLVKDTDCCASEAAENLFRLHILGVPTDRLEMIGGKVHSILDSTSDLLDNTSGHLEQFNREMTHTQAVLDEAVDPAEIRPLVTGLIKASESMITSNSELSQQLTIRSGEIERLKHEIETIRAEAALDPLTGVANRKTLQEAIVNALANQSSSQKRYVCLIMIDIDRFKVVNDNFGHLVGDRVLRYVAEVLTESVKGKDTVARFGGEEFCVVLPNTTPEGAQAVAENIRKTIEEARLRRGKDGTLLGKIT
ncbi:MAG TPA: GGDEF domain-containing protein, partial [Gammaproteobacteria bacterium]|nr:GGDEF domain-containing protein [Gammaproteobacteria bacterium]